MVMPGAIAADSEPLECLQLVEYESFLEQPRDDKLQGDLRGTVCPRCNIFHRYQAEVRRHNRSCNQGFGQGESRGSAAL